MSKQTQPTVVITNITETEIETSVLFVYAVSSSSPKFIGTRKGDFWICVFGETKEIVDTKDEAISKIQEYAQYQSEEDAEDIEKFGGVIYPDQEEIREALKKKAAAPHIMEIGCELPPASAETPNPEDEPTEEPTPRRELIDATSRYLLAKAAKRNRNFPGVYPDRDVAYEIGRMAQAMREEQPEITAYHASITHDRIAYDQLIKDVQDAINLVLAHRDEQSDEEEEPQAPAEPELSPDAQAIVDAWSGLPYLASIPASPNPDFVSEEPISTEQDTQRVKMFKLLYSDMVFDLEHAEPGVMVIVTKTHTATWKYEKDFYDSVRFKDLEGKEITPLSILVIETPGKKSKVYIESMGSTYGSDRALIQADILRRAGTIAKRLEEMGK